MMRIVLPVHKKSLYLQSNYKNSYMEENTKEYRISTDSVKIAVSDVSRIVLSHESETKYELEHKKGDVSHRGFPDFWKIYYYENRVWHNTTWGIFLYEDEIYSDSRYKIVGDDIHVNGCRTVFLCVFLTFAFRPLVQVLMTGTESCSQNHCHHHGSRNSLHI